MSKPAVLVAPSILSADFRVLEKEVKQAEACGADRIHCDVMDGHFVPNLTFGPLLVEAVKKCVSIPLDVHLMISNPQKYITQYCDAGANVLIVHAEVCESDLEQVLSDIRKRNVRAGASINPDKGVDLLLPHLAAMDQALIMTVYAGFGGQKFIPEMLPKIKTLAGEASRRNPKLDIEVDGGINRETAALCAREGANVFVAGNYVFKAEDYKERISAIRNAAEEARKKG
ncbi:MAG TPA: ribulose-phosphate 3-epimerase [Chitinivibrionales bacterium]|nr:ribulose-phosphate 3-epimerase [Chitinivibrionales bacterium]